MAEEYRLLLPLESAADAEELIKLAAGILHGRKGKVIALRVVEVPEGESLSQGAILARHHRRLLQRLSPLAAAEGIELESRVRVSRRAWQGIQEVVAEEGVHLVLFGWSGRRKGPRQIFGATIEEMVTNPPCDIAVLKQRGLGDLKRILLPVRGGPHAELALGLAHGIAERFGATITLLHIDLEASHWSQRQQEERLFADFLGQVQGWERIRRLSIIATSVEEAILAEAGRHQLLLMGATGPEPSKGVSLFGTLPERVVARAPSSVMVVRTRRRIEPSLFQRPREPISALVDRWFAENTFHCRDFAQVEELIAAKHKQRITISLGLPALNQEATVGSVIRVLKEELLLRKPLLDEMVLIDYGSQDRTMSIASDLGIPVYSHQEILPQYGSYAGKGDALWKSLHVLKGDIIVWIDTDVKNIHPKFVYGLVGPLLTERRLKLVKGFYRRPLRIGNVLYETGSGRATELTVRPLLNLFFPELSGMIQPLSRECAARREALEQIPFCTGFGVEIGHLIDILSRFGLFAIAQSDLEERIHRNQPLFSLSQRAFALVQAMMRRLEESNKVRLLEDMNTSMKLIHYEESAYSLEVKEIGERERPPMVSIPEYGEKARSLAVRT